MAKSDNNDTGKREQQGGLSNRRDFMKLSTMGALATIGTQAVANPLTGRTLLGDRAGTGNTMPGRIVLCHNPEMMGHASTIDKDLTEEMVHRSVKLLTGQTDVAAAFESLFPGLHAGSTFAIKVNCIASCCTRWEVVRGVVSGLAQMLGSTFNVGQIVIFDRHNLHSYGYDEAEFTYNGHTPTISHSNQASGSGYNVYGSHTLSQYLLDCDYVINMPALKSHSDGNNQITVALKNHYGSCYSSSLCGNITGMLTVNSDTNIKDKTCLVVTDGLRATYNGGPGTPPMYWSNYDEQTPNTIFVTTDPITNDYWARDIINAQRVASGMSERPCTWIEQGSGSSWEIGISDPAEMTVLNFDPVGVADMPINENQGTFLSPNSPNPFSSTTTLRFRLARSGQTSLKIYDVQGRQVRRLVGEGRPEGYSSLIWDGRSDHGELTPTGVYFARLEANNTVSTRRLVLTR
ncbi:MAG: DUF362 domain-containing protein [bacterium]|nr:DUF362 domain-containing protein [bacterium]